MTTIICEGGSNSNYWNTTPTKVAQTTETPCMPTEVVLSTPKTVHPYGSSSNYRNAVYAYINR
jgi:hypothetical protein